MKNAIHKAGIIFLLLLTAAPVIYTFCFHLEQHRIRQQARERLEIEAQQTLVLDAEKMYWTSSGKEAWINGRLFDISSQHTENGICTLTGIFDEEETALVMLLQQRQQQHNDSDDEFLSQLFELLQDVYKNQPDEQPGVISHNNLSYITHNSPLSSVPLSIITPPPQMYQSLS